MTYILCRKTNYVTCRCVVQHDITIYDLRRSNFFAPFGTFHMAYLY
jgi:hypothetical protein